MGGSHLKYFKPTIHLLVTALLELKWTWMNDQDLLVSPPFAFLLPGFAFALPFVFLSPFCARGRGHFVWLATLHFFCLPFGLRPLSLACPWVTRKFAFHAITGAASFGVTLVLAKLRLAADLQPLVCCGKLAIFLQPLVCIFLRTSSCRFWRRICS